MANRTIFRALGADTIEEYTDAAGVTVDSLLIKDGAVGADGNTAARRADGGAVTALVKKAPSGTAPASGTSLHASGSLDLKGTVNTDQAATLSATAADLLLAAGDALCLDVTGTTTAARGCITVTLVPV